MASFRLYPTNEGGRKHPIEFGFMCPCSAEKEPTSDKTQMWTCAPLLGEEKMNPGETRIVGFVFIAGDIAAAEVRHAGKFYLWDGRNIGEGVVLSKTEPCN